MMWFHFTIYGCSFFRHSFSIDHFSLASFRMNASIIMNPIRVSGDAYKRRRRGTNRWWFEAPKQKSQNSWSALCICGKIAWMAFVWPFMKSLYLFFDGTLRPFLLVFLFLLLVLILSPLLLMLLILKVGVCSVFICLTMCILNSVKCVCFDSIPNISSTIFIEKCIFIRPTEVYIAFPYIANIKITHTHAGTHMNKDNYKWDWLNWVKNVRSSGKWVLQTSLFFRSSKLWHIKCHIYRVCVYVVYVLWKCV